MLRRTSQQVVSRRWMSTAQAPMGETVLNGDRVNLKINTQIESQSLEEKQALHLWHPMTQQGAWSKKEAMPPAPIVSSEGSSLIRADGAKILDGIAGLWCVNVGYGREELAQIAYEAMRNLPYHAPTMGSPAQIELATKISSLLQLEPSKENGGGHVFFTSSGSEANETAFKIARQYHAARGDVLRHKIVSRYRAYHGNTSGSMAATGQAERKMGYGVEPAGFVKVPPPYPYRRAPQMSVDEHVAFVLATMEDTFTFEGPESIAAVIMEPVISGGGVLVPTDKYLPGVRALCDKYGALLILDEVVSGYGRLGTMFGHQVMSPAGSDITKPDIITMAKGLTSGYLPLGACAVSDTVFSHFQNDPSSALPGRLAHLRQVNTYGGHPVACAVGLKNIEILEAEALPQRAAEIGTYFYNKLNEAIAHHPLVGEVRHKGLLLGVELVEDKISKTPLAEHRSAAVPAFCAKHNIIVGRNGQTIPSLCNVLVLAPPLVITKEECDQIVDVLAQALHHVHTSS